MVFPMIPASLAMSVFVCAPGFGYEWLRIRHLYPKHPLVTSYLCASCAGGRSTSSPLGRGFGGCLGEVVQEDPAPDGGAGVLPCHRLVGHASCRRREPELRSRWRDGGEAGDYQSLALYSARPRRLSGHPLLGSGASLSA